MKVVLDTSILVNGCSTEDIETHAACVYLMKVVELHHSLVVDADGAIFAEYRLQAIRNGTFAEAWWQTMLYAKRIATESGHLQKVSHDYAVAKGCHQKDFKFLGVAKRSGAHLFHEDSDYENPAVAHLGVHASRSRDAPKILRP